MAYIKLLAWCWIFKINHLINMLVIDLDLYELRADPLASIVAGAVNGAQYNLFLSMFHEADVNYSTLSNHTWLCCKCTSRTIDWDGIQHFPTWGKSQKIESPCIQSKMMPEGIHSFRCWKSKSRRSIHKRIVQSFLHLWMHSTTNDDPLEIIESRSKTQWWQMSQWPKGRMRKRVLQTWCTLDAPTWIWTRSAIQHR